MTPKQEQHEKDVARAAEMFEKLFVDLYSRVVTSGRSDNDYEAHAIRAKERAKIAIKVLFKKQITDAIWPKG